VYFIDTFYESDARPRLLSLNAGLQGGGTSAAALRTDNAEIERSGRKLYLTKPDLYSSYNQIKMIKDAQKHR
jgi:hypothetical protein